jgi:acyl carrier protein phosphodiesterase
MRTVAKLTPLQEQALAARRCHRALDTLVKEYPKVFKAANREDEGWDGDTDTLGRVSLDEMYDTVLALEDTLDELSNKEARQ